MIEKVKSMKASARAFLFPALVGAATAGSSVVAFAAETGSPTLDLPQINITTEMLTTVARWPGNYGDDAGDSPCSQAYSSLYWWLTLTTLGGWQFYNCRSLFSFSASQAAG